MACMSEGSRGAAGEVVGEVVRVKLWGELEEEKAGSKYWYRFGHHQSTTPLGRWSGIGCIPAMPQPQLGKRQMTPGSALAVTPFRVAMR
jgi:hypothetical protein